MLLSKDRTLGSQDPIPGRTLQDVPRRFRKPLSGRWCAYIPTKASAVLERSCLPRRLSQKNALHAIRRRPLCSQNSLDSLKQHCVELIDQIQEKDASWNGITFGLETAYYDLLARHAGVDFADVLGGALDTSIEDYFSISEEQPDRVCQRITMAGPQRKVIQIKTGVYSLAHELGLIRTALDLMHESQTLLVDANGGWSLAQASEAIDAIQDPRLIWEEPCASYEENRNLLESFDTQILLDGETSRDSDTAIACH